MAPLLSEDEFELAVAEGDVVVLVVVVVVVVDEGADEVVEVAELLGSPTVPVFALPVPPSAVKFTYAAQSGLGSARGQDGSWQREKSCGPIAGLRVTGGAQRTLYRALRLELKVSASWFEKPLWRAALVIMSMK